MFDNNTAVIAKIGDLFATRVRVYTLGNVEHMTTPNPPPTAKLLRDARERMSPPITIFEAARRASVSEGTWRNAARGTRHLPGGRLSAYEPDPPTLARMSRAVGVTPAELRAIGRQEAAEILEADRPTGDARLAQFDDETLLRELLNRATRVRNHADAPSTKEVPGDYALAARVGRDERPPAPRPEDESQDPGTDEPA